MKASFRLGENKWRCSINWMLLREPLVTKLESLGIQDASQIPRSSKTLKMLGFTKIQIEDLRKAFKLLREIEKDKHS